MKRENITINAVPDWKLSYPPELVGEYLSAHWESLSGWGYGGVKDFKPGMILPMPPEPTLEAFLTWCYQRTEQGKQSYKSSKVRKVVPPKPKGGGTTG